MTGLITSADVKAWLDIDPLDTSRDTLLTELAQAASDACIDVMGRDPRRSTHDETVNGMGCEILPVNHYPILSVTSVSVLPPTGSYDITASDLTFYDNAIYHRTGYFPRGIRNIHVVWDAGLDPLPEHIILAAKYTAKAMWDARKTDMNATGENWAGIGGSGFWPTGPGSVPPQARVYLARYARTVRV